MKEFLRSHKQNKINKLYNNQLIKNYWNNNKILIF